MNSLKRYLKIIKNPIRNLRTQIEKEYYEIENQLNNTNIPEEILYLENKRKSLSHWIGAYYSMPSERYLIIKHLL